MAKSLPAAPLRALQAFNEVVRAGSVATAADELAAAIAPAFATIDESLKGFRRRDRELRISLLSSFAVHWLIPRLSRFQALHSDIELFLSTSTRMVNLATESFDCAIRLGLGSWPNVVADELYREELVVACSPHLLPSGRVLALRDIRRATLLQSRARPRDWDHWFKAAGIDNAEGRAGQFRKGPVFETRALAIQAAIGRMGFAVIDPRFIEAELATGQLIVAHPLRVQLDDAYWLAFRPDRESTRPVAAFRRWLATELASGYHAQQ